MSNNQKWIQYTRVSTDDKGQTRDQQIKAIQDEAKRRGAEIIDEVFDEESGKHNDRRGLRIAIARAIENNATLVVSRADRLSRDMAFALKVIFHRGIKVLCLNLGDEAMKDEFVCSIYFGIAQKESQDKSERNKDKASVMALAYERANAMYREGYDIEDIIAAEPLAAATIRAGHYAPGEWRFGNPRAKETSNQKKANAARIKKANSNDKSVSAANALREYFATNPINLNAAARYLKSEGFLTPRGTTNHTPQSVKNLCARFGIAI